MTKNRVPTSKLSWIGMATNEIDEITTFGSKRAAKLARGLADFLMNNGKKILAYDPREMARANYSIEARQARREQEEEARRQSDHLMGYDGFDDWVAQHAGRKTNERQAA